MSKLDVTAMRAPSIGVFSKRGNHGFRPTIQVPAEWKLELEGMARELG